MAGRRRKPTALKLVQGNAGHRPLPKNEPKPEIASLAPPADMDEAALRYWAPIAAKLVAARILTEVDVDALVLYCDSCAAYQNAKEQIEKYGPIVKAPSGYVQPSPYVAIKNKAWDQMKSMMGEFGMTPASRTRVNAAGSEESDNPFAELG